MLKVTFPVNKNPLDIILGDGVAKRNDEVFASGEGFKIAGFGGVVTILG